MKQWTESKAERKSRKALEKQGLSTVEQIDHKTDYLEAYKQSANKNYVVCLKWGDKYSSDYVNKLYNMVKRNLTIDYEFVCFTDSSQGIDKHIRTEPLPRLPVVGWWYKTYFFSNDLPIKGTILFLDLDMVIFNNIDSLFLYNPDTFCIIKDFNRSFRKGWDRMNSSVFRLQTGMFDNLWQDFKKNPALHLQRNRGDQDWMYRYIQGHSFWPDDWIQSYKWEMRDKNKLAIINGKRNFVDVSEPKVLPNTKIAVFHGDPNPADCKDPWVVDRWR